MQEANLCWAEPSKNREKLPEQELGQLGRLRAASSLRAWKAVWKREGRKEDRRKGEEKVERAFQKPGAS